MPYEMSRLLLVVVFWLAFVEMSWAQQKQVCVTVDDLPVVNYGNDDPEFLKEVTEKLITTFDAHSIPAIGYVNERKLYKDGRLDESNVALLEYWLEAGYELGNHTYSHHNYHKTPFNTFTEDILKGEKITRPLSEKYGMPYRFFRHPYLRIGKTQSSADSLSSFLSDQGYTESPVTIDPDDYLFAKAYHIALKKGDSLKASKVATAYLKHIEKKIQFYEEVSTKLFNRNISHTLLIHANLLNADYLGEVAQIFKKKGYTFISQEEVLKDTAYGTPVTRYGDWGMSWMDRWAMTQGKNTLLRDDPLVPEFILK